MVLSFICWALAIAGIIVTALLSLDFMSGSLGLFDTERIWNANAYTRKSVILFM